MNFNSAIFIIDSMDLFLVNDTASKGVSTKVLVVGAIGVAALFTLLKLFSSIEQDDGDDHENPQQQEVRKPAGIINQGNTCFVNSLLQALASLKSFENNLEEVIANFKPHLSKSEELLVELSAVMKQINGNSESIGVENLLDLINTVKEGLINLEQQDAHELYAALIGSFEEVINKQKNIDLSNSARLADQEGEEKEIENRLIGFTKSSITCTVCRNETAIKIHPFYDLSLEIRSNYVVDIRSALQQFQREERIESWTCTSCTIIRHTRKLREAMNKLSGVNAKKLAFIGQAIIEHLQSSDNLEDDISEINSSLSNFVLAFKQEYQNMESDPDRDAIFVEMEGVQTTILKKTIITKYPKILVIHLKQLIINPLTGEPQLIRKHIGFDDTLTFRLKNGEKRYNLTSLLTHIGNESMGHYFTFRRENRESNNWFVISDSYSKRCQWDYVRASRAYILFFQAD